MKHLLACLAMAALCACASNMTPEEVKRTQDRQRAEKVDYISFDQLKAEFGADRPSDPQ